MSEYHRKSEWPVSRSRNEGHKSLVQPLSSAIPVLIAAVSFLVANAVRSVNSIHAADSDPPPATKPAKVYDHYGKEVLGFDWKEQDSVDDRWNQSRIGRFLASVIPLPGQPAIAKGLSIHLGEPARVGVAYDTESGALRAAWRGGLLRFDPARMGIIHSPQINGDVDWVTEAGPLCLDHPVRYRGLHWHDPRVTLEWDLGGMTWFDHPTIATLAGETAFLRRLLAGERGSGVTLSLGKLGAAIEWESIDAQTVVGRITAADHPSQGLLLIVREESGRQLIFEPTAPPVGQEPATALGRHVVLMQPQPGHVTCWYPSGRVDAQLTIAVIRPGADSAASKNLDWKAMLTDWPAFPGSDDICTAGPDRRAEPIVTKGIRGEEPGPYAVDTLTLPFENPDRALFFVGGHDFLPDGRIAICTVHGDVWVVSGVDDQLSELRWQRFATGLFQPLGLKVWQGLIHVLGRDQITRLVDANGDDQADRYECFSNRLSTSIGGHDYTTGFEVDDDGRFFYLHAREGLQSISPDGETVTTLATGFRNPNGMGRSPNGVLTVAPQEGEWTPASCIFETWPGSYGGFGGPKDVTATRPDGYDPPLCWLPRMTDNSCGGQVWVTSDRWGLPVGQMLHLSYGQCRLLATVREEVAVPGAEHGLVQGGAVSLPLSFSSGVMRGSFSPFDGQLYLSGLKGWSNAAVHDGCLQRVRYQGGPVSLPTRWASYRNGLAVTFACELERSTAEDPGNYRYEHWNYRYASSYGSREYRPSQPTVEGRESLTVVSATLDDDGRTVFLEIPDITAVHQLGLTWSLRRSDGQPFRQTLYGTAHRLRDDVMPAERLHRPTTGTANSIVTDDWQPGVELRFAQGEGTTHASDARSGRTLAWSVPAGEAPTPFLPRGPTQLEAKTHLRVDLPGEYQFQIEGNTPAVLVINDGEVIAHPGSATTDSPAGDQPGVSTATTASSRLGGVRGTTSPPMNLRAGWLAIGLRTELTSEGSRGRVLWRSDSFGWEPLPPTLLRYDPHQEELQTSAELRRARQQIGELRCFRCHDRQLGVDALPELVNEAPPLHEVASRLHPDWLQAWLTDPQSLRPGTAMPACFRPADPQSGQDIADVTAYLLSMKRVGAIQGASPRHLELPADARDRGRDLYEDLGCLACHRLNAPTVSDPWSRLSLAHVAAKFVPEALVDYLRVPHRHHHATRMPNFGLSETEATDLVAFLLTAGDQPLPAHESVSSAAGEAGKAIAISAGAWKSGDPERGRARVRRAQCANCHPMAADASPASTPPALAQGSIRDRGCLGPTPSLRGIAPHFSLSDTDRLVLTRFLLTDRQSLKRRTIAESAEDEWKNLNCAACHSRDGRPSPRGELILEESTRGLNPEQLPDLTWAGEKLQPRWTQRFLAGDLRVKPREWLKARMPAFPESSQLLAQGMAAEWGYLPLEEYAHKEPPVDAELAAIGERLTARKTGLDCRQCHAVGGEKPVGDERTEIAPGINFALSRERLRGDHFLRFVMDPPRFDIGTKMPKLVQDGHTTRLSTIYDGDARRQFEAIWEFVRTVRPASGKSPR